MPTATAIVLAAGEGTRMKSNHAKVAHKILGKPMISWVVDAAIKAGCERVVIVVGSHAADVRGIVKASYGGRKGVHIQCVEQEQRLGTAHAVRVAIEATGTLIGPVVVLNGDLPLIRPKTIARFAEAVDATQDAAAILTFTPPDPEGYGRIELDEAGRAVRNIEQKDCTPAQAASLSECNAGCYAFDGAVLAKHITEVGNNNAQGEYYLPDMLEILRAAGESIEVLHLSDYTEGLGVNSRAQLAQLTAIARDRINTRLMSAGVSFIDPTQAWVGPDAKVGRDTVIWPQTYLIGATQVGEDCQLGPNTRLTDTRVGDGCVLDETVAIEAVLENDVTCGPRVYLRPGTHMLDRSKAGTHVEIKKSTIGAGSKVPHLSYIGDTKMGAGVNIGAGAITCNYDGVLKHKTTIGDNVFVGSDTMMVAPVEIGTGALVAAGSVITEKIPANALGIARSRQTVIEDWAPGHRKGLEEQKLAKFTAREG